MVAELRAMVNTELTISLPPTLYRRAKQIALITQRDLAELVVNSLEFSLPTTRQLVTTLQPVSFLSDKHLLQVANLQFTEEEDDRLSDLLTKQREDLISAEEAQELNEIMQFHQLGMLRKSEALVEAVKRDLMPPLSA